jgi:hypothetical protein
MVPILPQPSTAIFFADLVLVSCAVCVCVVDELMVSTPFFAKNEKPAALRGQRA